jgi:hypothetical protein
MEHQLDATVTVFIDLQDRLNMFRASFCPSSGESHSCAPEDGQKLALNMLS